MTKLFNANYKLILKAILTISLLLAALSAYEVSVGKFADFEPLLFWFGIPFGAFVWGDLLAFASIWALISIVLLKGNNPRFFWIAFFSFWAVRSLGEANYWFLQQFHPEVVPWPQHFARVWILKNLSDPEFWVWNQIFHQSVAIGAVVGLVYQIAKLIKEH